MADYEKTNDPMPVLLKINKIMGEIKAIKKDGRIAFGSTNYNFIQDDEVVAVIREKMVENQLVMYPEMSHSNVFPFGEAGKEKLLTVTEQCFKIADAETGSFIVVTTVGQGADSADKGSGKSMTNARKYALLQTFMLTGDDPDKVASDSYHAGGQAAATTTTTTGGATSDGRFVIDFGKHKGKYLDELLKTDDGKQWANWYIEKGTNPAVKARVQEELNKVSG
jgi:hypothetical protein